MMTYEYEPEQNVIHLKASGVVVASDPIEYFEKLDNDPSFEGVAEERIYFIDVEDISFSYKDIVNIAAAFSKFGHGEKISKGIFIVDSDLSYGMARMIISIFDGVFDHFEVHRVDPTG